MYKCINGWTKGGMKEQIRLRNTGEKSMDLKNNCKYKILGNSCVAGCFIKDEDYDKSFENQAIDTLMFDNQNIVMSMPLDDIGMKQLQLVHDGYIPVNETVSLHERLFNWIDKNVK